MEPKDKMYSEPQKEVKNSDIKSEITETNEPLETVDTGNTVEEVKSEEPKVVREVEPVEAIEEPVAESKVDNSSDIIESNDVVKSLEERNVVSEQESETEEASADTAADKQEEPVVESEVVSAIEAGETDDTSELEEEVKAVSVKKSEKDDTQEETVEVAEDKQEEPVEPDIAEKAVSEKEGEIVINGDVVVEEVELAQQETTEEPKESQKEPEEQEIDYSTLSEVELINEFRDLIENRDFIEIHHKVDAIKLNFYKKHKVKLQEQKKKFIDEGGFEEEFKPDTDPYEQDLKDLMAQYRQKKTQYNKHLENEKDENLQKKYKIIEEIKTLVNRKESINKTFQEFKELQQQWHDTGLVPQASMKDLWENYHHHVENFYDYIKINKELRDLDLKKNMEEKIILCEKAEALLLEPSVIKAFNSLQKLHDTWREIGPVPRDKKEELWERFKDATTKINKKHQDFFENRKKSQKKNLETKAALCEKVEEILAMDIASHKEWEEISKEIIDLQKYWRTIGFAPKKENNAIYERFRLACDGFFDKKREFYSKHKEIQSNNLQMKIDLCMQAESLKESTDWRKATDEYIAIQKKWKEIGPVPRKHSDTVWKRFRAACDYFFERKSTFFSSIDETQVENLKLKNGLIDAVTNFQPSGDDNADFEKLRDFQRRWTEIGHVPIAEKNEVQKRFRDSINVQFDKLRVDDRDRNLLKFKNKVSGLKSNSRGQNKVYAERDKYVSKLKHLESDLITLKNNIGFFANSKNAEALIKDVEQKITNNEEQIEYLKDKIRIIDEADNNEE